MSSNFVPLDVVAGFVSRTVARGTPMRVALVRAEKKYGIDRKLVRTFMRQGMKNSE